MGSFQRYDRLTECLSGRMVEEGGREKGAASFGAQHFAFLKDTFASHADLSGRSCCARPTRPTDVRSRICTALRWKSAQKIAAQKFCTEVQKICTAHRECVSSRS